MIISVKFINECLYAVGHELFLLLKDSLYLTNGTWYFTYQTEVDDEFSLVSKPNMCRYPLTLFVIKRWYICNTRDIVFYLPKQIIVPVKFMNKCTCVVNYELFL